MPLGIQMSCPSLLQTMHIKYSQGPNKNNETSQSQAVLELLRYGLQGVLLDALFCGVFLPGPPLGWESLGLGLPSGLPMWPWNNSSLKFCFREKKLHIFAILSFPLSKIQNKSAILKLHEMPRLIRTTLLAPLSKAILMLGMAPTCWQFCLNVPTVAAGLQNKSNKLQGRYRQQAENVFHILG